MSDTEKEIEAAAAALAVAPCSLADAPNHVPDKPGLYAVCGDGPAWRELGLGDPPDERPLYVGKAEESLFKRDLKTHFVGGRTGSSTVRRSFAALLRTTLDLHAEPRNPEKPERFCNYGLKGEGDDALTAWMRSRLKLAVWPKGECELIYVERGLLGRSKPPLNLKGSARHGRRSWRQRAL